MNIFFQEKDIPIRNILSTAGAPAMIGRHNGLIAHLKQAVPNVLAIHCVLYRQHLFLKKLSERLHTSPHYVIRAVNKIRNNSLTDCLADFVVKTMKIAIVFCFTQKFGGFQKIFV